MLSAVHSELIANLFYDLDKCARFDLSNNKIADERDYISRLVTHFNYPFGVLNRYGFPGIKFSSKWFARVNSGNDERRFGCDSMIVFQVDTSVKVGLFEAKWPRVKIDPSYNWDYIQKTKKKSHFSDQIERQSKWTEHAAIWEMFFYEEKVNIHTKPFDKYGSTCIRHSFAKKYIEGSTCPSTIWDNNDLEHLIESAQTQSLNVQNETNLKTIINDILNCSYGKPITVSPTVNSFQIKPNDDLSDSTAAVDCPLLNFNEDIQEDNEDSQKVINFMQHNGLSFFQFLLIEETINEDDIKI